ncbi:hypothetical protein [Massilia aerilata]|uniref:DUF2190 family protein n=1 Tax=Massilia aerilata TaxID=453817 RepID=A0ABW0S1L5_9BURK
MQRLPKQIAVAELAVAAADLYTTPANTKTTISACSVTNKTAAARNCTLAIRPAGGTARNVAFGMVIAAGETRVVHGALAQTMEAGSALVGSADAAGALDIVVSAYETNP